MPPTGAKPQFTLLLLSAAELMVVLDFTIVAVALPDIQRDLGIAESRLQWLLSAYALANSGVLLLGGRAADLFGRRRIVLAGIGLFTLASLVGGLARDPVTLIAMRALQGLGGAAIVPAVLSIVTTTFAEGAPRNRAIGILGAISAIGFSAGMVAGGVITERWGWPGVFWVNVPIGIVLMATIPFVVAERRDAAGQGSDVAGALSVTLGLAVLAHGIAELGAPSWRGPLALAAGGALLGIFVAVERRTPAPMLPLSVFASSRVALATFLELMLGAAVTPLVFLLTLHFQGVAGYSALMTGLAFLPHGLAAIVMMGPISRLITRLGPRTVTLAGIALYVVGAVPLLRLTPESGYVRDLLPALLVTAPGLMAAFIAVFVAGTSAVGPDRQGLISGLLATAQQVGASLGLALMGALIADGRGLQPGFVALIVLSAAAIVPALLLPRRPAAAATG